MLLIFDANYPRSFVDAFKLLETSNKNSPVHVDIIFSDDFMGKQGADDEEIIVKADNLQAVIITHDSDFKRIKHYKTLLVKHRVGYVYFKTAKRQTYWDIVKAFVNKWEEIKKQAEESNHPFALEISKHGHLQKLDF